MVERLNTPIQSAKELLRRGFRYAIFPGGTAQAVAHTLQRYYSSLQTYKITLPMQAKILDFVGQNAVIKTPELIALGVAV